MAISYLKFPLRFQSILRHSVLFNLIYNCSLTVLKGLRQSSVENVRVLSIRLIFERFPVTSSISCEQWENDSLPLQDRGTLTGSHWTPLKLCWPLMTLCTLQMVLNSRNQSRARKYGQSDKCTSWAAVAAKKPIPSLSQSIQTYPKFLTYSMFPKPIQTNPKPIWIIKTYPIYCKIGFLEWWLFLFYFLWSELCPKSRTVLLLITVEIFNFKILGLMFRFRERWEFLPLHPNFVIFGGKLDIFSWIWTSTIWGFGGFADTFCENFHSSWWGKEWTGRICTNRGSKDPLSAWMEIIIICM